MNLPDNVALPMIGYMTLAFVVIFFLVFFGAVYQSIRTINLWLRGLKHIDRIDTGIVSKKDPRSRAKLGRNQ